MSQFDIYLEAYGHFNLRQLKDNELILERAINEEGDELYEKLDKPDLKIALKAVKSLIQAKE